MSATMMTETELRLVTTVSIDGSRVRARRRLHLRVTEEKLDAAKLWKLAIDPACNQELALMLLDRCVECLRKAKSLEQVLAE